MLPIAVRGPYCRVAILLPAIWHGGMLRNAWALADTIGDLRAPDGRPLEVVIGFRRDGAYDWPAFEARARQASYRLSIRKLDWSFKPPAILNVMAARELIPEGLVTYGWMPRDGLHDFLDCEGWIVFGTSLEGYVAPLRPRIIYCADHISRYVPEAERFRTPEHKKLTDETFLGWRHARCVFATTPRTISDTVSYAGVVSRNVKLVPTLIDPVRDTPVPQMRPPGDRILWVTNPARHKNHLKALEALRLYWQEFDGRLDVLICGPSTDQLRPASASDHPFAEALRNRPRLIERIAFAGEADDAAFLDLIADSAFVWHNVIMDNGTFTAFDAARAGRHFVSSDYPSMRYLADRYGIDGIWFPATDARAAAAALREAERRLRAGEAPRHVLVADDPQERVRAYQGLLDTLLAP